jgi:hypothetical protein
MKNDFCRNDLEPVFVSDLTPQMASSIVRAIQTAKVAADRADAVRSDLVIQLGETHAALLCDMRSNGEYARGHINSDAELDARLSALEAIVDAIDNARERSLCF